MASRCDGLINETLKPGTGGLSVLLFDESREGVDVLLQNLLQRFLGTLAFVVEGIANGVQIGFRLPKNWAGDTRQDMLQMLGRVDAAERTRRVANDADRLAEEGALAIGARADVDGVLQDARDRADIFGRHEQNAVRLLQLFAEREPVGRGRRFKVLAEIGNACGRHDVELERSRRELGQGIGDLERKALLAEAAGDRDDGMSGHWISLVKQKRLHRT